MAWGLLAVCFIWTVIVVGDSLTVLAGIQESMRDSRSAMFFEFLALAITTMVVIGWDLVRSRRQE